MLCLHDSQLITRLFSGFLWHEEESSRAPFITTFPSNASKQCSPVSQSFLSKRRKYVRNKSLRRPSKPWILQGQGLFGETNPEVDCPSGGWTNGKIYQINSKHIGRKNIIKTKKRTASQIAPTSRPLTASGFAHSVWVCKERIIGKNMPQNTWGFQANKPWLEFESNKSLSKSTPTATTTTIL